MALVGGYENELLEPSEDLQWDCSICLQIVREPCMVSCCSLRFCRPCIEQIQRQRNPCPHCQERRFTIVSDTQLKRLLLHKRVYCINKNAGCQWVGELKEAEKHVRVDCMRTEVACPNQCGQRFLRCSLNQHATEECPRCPRLCEFAAMGCESGALTPDGLQYHMQRSMAEHLILVCKKLEETALQEALKMSKSEAMILARDAKIRELETAVQAHEKSLSIGELEAVAQVHEARVGELEAVVRAREARIAELEATVQVREARELEARVEARQAEVKELEARVQDREARIKQLETSAQVRNERIRELESTAEAQKAKISELKTTIKLRNARIKKLSVVVQTHKTKLEKVEALLQERDGQMRILKTIVDASETWIGKLEDTLQAREAAMDKMDTQLQVQNARIQLEVMTQTVNARVLEIEKTKVTELQEKIWFRNLVLLFLGAALMVTAFMCYLCQKWAP